MVRYLFFILHLLPYINQVRRYQILATPVFQWVVLIPCVEYIGTSVKSTTKKNWGMHNVEERFLVKYLMFWTSLQKRKNHSIATALRNITSPFVIILTLSGELTWHDLRSRLSHNMHRRLIDISWKNYIDTCISSSVIDYWPRLDPNRDCVRWRPSPNN